MPNLGLVRNFSPTEIFRRAATGAGNAFSVPSRAENAVFSAVGLGGTITALTADLEVSHDGGTVWGKVQTGINIFTAPTRVNVTGLAGALCRLNATALTLGTGSAALVNATVT